MNLARGDKIVTRCLKGRRFCYCSFSGRRAFASAGLVPEEHQLKSYNENDDSPSVFSIRMNNNRKSDWDPKSELASRDQVSVYDEMRQHCPVAHSDMLGWSIFRHADVKRILNDHESFSNVVSQHLTVPDGMDPPEHIAYREAIEPYFPPERIEQFEPACRRIADDLIERAFVSDRDVEVTNELASQFAARVQCAFLGWPDGLSTRLIEWVENSHQAIRGANRTAMSHLARQFEAIVDQQVDQRIVSSADPHADVTSSLMHQHVFGRKLNSEELSSILRNWTVGEIGTIAASIGILLHHLAEDKQLQSRMRDDLALLPTAIDEILRIHNPLVTNRRVTKCPVRIGDRDLDAGEKITLHWISANRDERAFDQADKIRVDRDSGNNLLYGEGIHVCPGAGLASMELRVFVESLFEKTTWIAPQPESPAVPAAYPTSGFESLVVRQALRI